MRSWRTHLIALGGVALVLTFGLLGIQETVKKVHTKQSHTNKSVGELVASAQVGQTFTAEHSGLFLVEVRFATLARENTGPLVFRLKTSPDAAQDLFTTTIETADLEDNAYHAFEFPPLPDSAGSTFCFCLEAPEAEPGNGITVWGATEDEYPDGEAVLVGLDDRGVRDLTFRLGYDPPLGEKASILLNRLAANKPSLWGDKRFYILLAVAYLALLYALFARAVGLTASEENK
ncbi:MAG TPA: hypothetical protein G4N99_11120 [Thermoflexia bacterium]|nr:hypothetical protein [Thermoflexia bacterium]